MSNFNYLQVYFLIRAISENRSAPSFFIILPLVPNIALTNIALTVDIILAKCYNIFRVLNEKRIFYLGFQIMGDWKIY